MPALYAHTLTSPLIGHQTVRLVPQPVDATIQRALGLATQGTEIVGAVHAAAPDFPEPLRAINAHDILALSKDIEWARRTAPGQPKKVHQRVDKVSAKLCETTPQLAPPFLEEAARTLAHCGHHAVAARIFTSARNIERTHNLAIDPARQTAAFTEFSRLGCIEAKELIHELRRCTTSFNNPQSAYDYAIDLVTVRSRAGQAPPAEVLDELATLGGYAGLSNQDVGTQLINNLCGTHGLRQITAEFLHGLISIIGTRHEVLRELFAEKSTHIDLDTWINAATESGLFKHLTPQQTQQWIFGLLSGAINLNYTTHSRELLNLIHQHSAALTGKRLITTFSSLSLEALAALERAGVVVEFSDSVGASTPHLCSHLKNASAGHQIDIEMAFSHRDVLERLTHDWDLTRFLGVYEPEPIRRLGLGPVLDHLAMRTLLDFKAGSNFLLPSMHKAVDELSHLVSIHLPPELLKQTAEMLTIDPADVLADNLRAGLLTELTLPDVEKTTVGQEGILSMHPDRLLPYQVTLSSGETLCSGACAPRVIRVAGITWMCEYDGTLHLPGFPADKGKLPNTLDASGRPHRLYSLPWQDWTTLEVRSATASETLRHTTHTQAVDLLSGALAIETFLGTEDQELVASVRQLIRHVKKLNARVVRLRNLVQVLYRNVSPVTPEMLEKAHKYRAGAEAQHFIDLNNRTNTPNARPWTWMRSFGCEKALVAWARGPLANPLARQETAAMFSVLSDAGMDSKQRKPSSDVDALAERYGLVPGLNIRQMAHIAHDFPQQLNVDPLVTALASNSALTEAAAKILFNGGFHPLHQRTRKPGEDLLQDIIDAEDRPRFEAAKKALRLSAKVFDNAMHQLRELDPRSVELLLIAAYDYDLNAVIQIACTLPHTAVPIDDATLTVLSGWYTRRDENNVVTLINHAARELPEHANLGINAGYGRILAATLWWATRAEANDPRRSFYARQLEKLKTLDNALIAGDGPTPYPIQGKIPDLPPISAAATADGFRALKDGLFDAVINGLHRTLRWAEGSPFNPQVSAHGTVGKVAEHLGLSFNAATYFLQLLALVNCTDVNVRQWNGWKKKDLDTARAELVTQSLVVVDRRARAGRSVFLPGTWWEATTPHYPMEEWKAAYYPVRFNGKAYSVVPWCPPLLPLDQLFEAPWQRFGQ